MSPRKRQSAVLDADVSIAEFEAAAAEAQARAAAARARADSLRQRVVEQDKSSAFDKFRDIDWHRPAWLLLPTVRLLAIAEAIVLLVASLTATVLMLWHHRNVDQQQQRVAEYSAAARQSIVTMMTVDPETVDKNMKTVIANATGKFKSTLEAGEAEELAKGVKESKVSTKATVQMAAVESMTDKSAVVLVAVSTDGTGPDNAKLPPAEWRISVSLEREDGQLKTSKFEFVP
jgi:Mce-associated membrane protein